MNPNIFFNNFDLLFEAPNGIQKLRELILQLAAQGKLLPQDPNDEPASVLLEKIKKEKEKLIKQKKFKPSKLPPPIEPKEIPYKIPKNWEWVRIGDVQLFTNGYVFKSSEYKESGAGIVRIGDIQDGEIRKTGMKFVDLSNFNNLDEKFKIKPGDLLIAMSGATTGKLGFNRTDETFLLNQRVGKIEFIGLDITFAYHYLSTKIRENLSISSGSAIPNLSTEQINNIIFPLPPIVEQNLIVAKVDQLLALCDELESQQKNEHKIKIQLNIASLNRLSDSANSKEFTKNWNRIYKTFDLLYDNLENLTQFRQSILQLAVQGKLVPQDPNDEPASVLLEKIKKEKEKLIKQKKIKGLEYLPPIKEEQIPLDIPESWYWTKLEEIKKKAFTGLERARSFQSIDYPYAYFKMNNISENGSCSFDEITMVNASKEEVLYYRLRNGDFLFNTRNSFELVGKTCVFSTQSKETFLFNNNILKINFFSGIDPKFINLWFQSRSGKDLLNKIKSSTTNVAAIYQGKLMAFSIPIAPSYEQKRIVEKVNQLMALCDELEEKLKQSQADSEKLMESIVHNLTVA